MKKNIKDKILTEKEKQFCELFVYGGIEYAGKPANCYEKVFGCEGMNTSSASRKLMKKPEITSKIKEMSDSLMQEHIAIKLQITETLKAVMEETATVTFEDKFGVTLSPAPLRAVSVNAAKALMELYPIKHIHETRLRIEGDKGGVTFNVVVPEINRDEEKEDYT